jgi:hypothetical protein
MIQSDYIKIFVITSSIVFTIFPVLYLNNAYKQMTEYERDQLSLSFPSMMILLPILFGVTFTLIYANFSSMLPLSVQSFKFFIIGAVSGAVVAVILNYGFNVSEQWLKRSRSLQSTLYMGVFYGVLLYVIGPLLLKGSNRIQPIGISSKSSLPKISTPGTSTGNKTSILFDKLHKKSVKA